MTTLIKKEVRDQCDLSCFELIMLGGSAVPTTLIDDIKVNLHPPGTAKSEVKVHRDPRGRQ